MANRGRNGGFYGVIDFNKESLPGLSDNIQFNIYAKSHTGNMRARAINRTGPLTTLGQPKFRLADVRGGFQFTGEFPANGYPVPSDIRYATGTLTQQLEANLTCVSQIRLTDLTWTHVEAGKNATEVWQVSGRCVLSGKQVWTWKGKQYTTTAPAANDSETFEGRSKTYDARGLRTAATVRIDCEGIGPLDATETAKLTALIAAYTTPPQPNLKPVTSTLTRGEDDSNGCQIAVQFALQDSKDDVETPRNTIASDPYDLDSVYTQAIVFPAGTPPSDPSVPTEPFSPTNSTPTALKLRMRTDQKLNDQYSFRLYQWTKRTTKDDRELEHRVTTVDPQGLQSEASDALLDGTPSTPSGFVSRGLSITYPTTDHNVQIIRGGVRTTADDLTFPGTFVDVDPNDLTTNGRQTLIFTTGGTVPSATVPTHTKIVGQATYQLTNASTTAKSYIVYRFEPTNSIDKVQYGESADTTDPNVIQSMSKITTVDAVPTLPSGSILVPRTYSKQNLSDWHYKETLEAGLRTTAEDITMPASSASRSLFDPFRKVVASLVASSDTDDNVAEAAWSGTSVLGSAFEQQAKAYGLSVKSINEYRKLLVLEYLDMGMRVIGKTRGGRRVLPAILNGDGGTSGNIFVYLTDIQQYSPGYYYAYHNSQVTTSLAVRNFLLVRSFDSSTSSIPDQFSIAGQTNNAPFLGLANGSCQFNAAEYDEYFAPSTYRRPRMFYFFSADMAGIFNYQGPRDTGFITSVNLSSYAPAGWVPTTLWASADKKIVTTVPTQADFSPFIT